MGYVLSIIRSILNITIIFYDLGLFSFLDEYYESLRREREAQEAKEEQALSPEPPTVTGYHDKQYEQRPSTAPVSHRKSSLLSTAEVQVPYVIARNTVVWQCMNYWYDFLV